MNYRTYITNFFKDVDKEIPCQILYDWRAVTGFISGTDLHDAFYSLVGKPCPSGYEQIPLEKVRPFLANYRDEFATEAAFRAAAIQYGGKSLDFGLDFGVEAITSLRDVSQLRELLKYYDSPKVAPGRFAWPNVYR